MIYFKYSANFVELKDQGVKSRLFLWGLLAVVFCTSCRTTRRLQSDEYLLTRNYVEIEPSRELPRSERVDKDELSQYIRQRPNKRLFGMPFYLWIYNLSAPEKQNWTKRIGEAPVIYDPVQTQRSARAMSTYLWGQGFINNDVQFSADTTRQKVRVQYDVKPGVPYRLGTIGYEFQDAFLEPIIQEDSVRTLLRTGDLFSVDVIQQERHRVADYLKNLGYFNFSFNNITPVADSVSNPGVVNLRMVVRQRQAGYDEENEPVMENNMVYRIREIYVQSDYNPNAAFQNTGYGARLDTLEERGIRFLYDRDQNIRPDVLIQAINIYPNDLYSTSDVNRAYDNLTKLNYFRNVNILFSEVTDTTSNLITFVGDEGASGNLTQEGYLTCHIQCTPGDKMGVTANVEGTGTSSYYGALASIGYQNRNVLKGVELLDFTLTAGYEFMRVKGRKNSLELGAAVGMTFPRFVAPFRIDRYNRMNNVKTRVELSVNSQNRPYYNRFLTSASYGYSWTNSRYSSFSVRPIDVTVVKMNSLDSVFFNEIQNEYLRNSYTSQLIMGISGSYIYNNQLKGVNRNTFRLRVNGETNGNLLHLITPAFTSKKDGNDYYKAFGIQYAQYVRSDLDVSYRAVTGLKTSLASRFYIGAAIPYGNSTNVPFERLFYSGGPNSMRGWQARTLGPGNQEVDKDAVYPIQLGNFKLEANLEFRFPVYKVFQGAVFADVGNIWMIGESAKEADESARFRLDRFYKQLGFNSGLGARFDFGFFLFRVDWGLRLHDPNKPSGERWISHLTLRQSAFSFNVGFPF